MGKLITEDIVRPKSFHGTFRFFDHLWALDDDGEFQKSYKEIKKLT